VAIIQSVLLLLNYRYERFEVLATFASTMLAILGALFVIKERLVFSSFLVLLTTYIN